MWVAGSAAGGAVTAAANVTDGGGVGVFRDASGGTLYFHSLLAGTAVDVSDTGNDITISVDLGTGASQAAAGDHTHAAADVVSGTFADARISASSVQQHPATQLDTTGAAVVISAAAPPTTGQVLEATSATTAAWVTPTAIPTDHVTTNTTQVLDASADKTYQATQSFVADKPIVFGSDVGGIAVTDNTAKEGVILGHNYTTFPGFADFEVLHYESPAGSNAPVVTIGAPASSSSLGPKTVRISTVPNYNSSAQTDVVTVTDKQMLIQDVAPTTAGPTTNNRAILELQSTTRGFLPPRMAGAPVPAAGLMYYNTTANEFSWYNGTVWVAPNDHVHDAADVTTGAFADARISASSVQQHPATDLKTATGTISVDTTDPPLNGAMLARTAAGVASWVRGVTSTDSTTVAGKALMVYDDATGTSATTFSAAGAGELVYSDAIDSWENLAAGTSGHHLRSGGTGAPAWSASTLENHTDVTVVSKANNDVLAWSSGDGAWTNITREIAPSRTYGSYYITTPAATTIGDSVNYFKFAGTTSLNLNSPGVSHIASNRLQYTGTATRVFSVEGTVSMFSTGANQTLSVAVFKNGVIDPSSEQSRTFSNATDLEECSTHAQITLATNDYVELWVKNATSTNAVTAQHMSVMLSALS
jgi:hypothetical protein